ncbi:ABC-type sugar transport system ATPase subunit [Kaistia hirudinis]|uniref:ABC-type sugar transport system ATPase subunit n=1 Tax=Kaistia hirudinis TaxID=1293440 RepID=A0A840ALQ4_9HYPH|nr:sugar ABC transporter ATP-binding protein [Kaistia hirudinis]MBB3929485.1 ABC-type sugar transport system ATPase subunit [Kaistia hirudinis]
MSEEAVRLAGIEKSFGSAKILNDISLTFMTGEVHALIGENGAGKSSLGKIVGGYYSFDAGTLTVFGKPVGQWTPRAALTSGIAMIHQELQLVPELTVAQNVFLGMEANRAGVLSGGEHERFRALDQRCGFGLDPGRIVADLRIAERQKVEILRAIARDARVIIMDEPTSSLTADEAERLHHVIRWLRDDGRTVIYVTHFLDHVLATADRVTIMRDGRIVRTGGIAGETKESLIEAMLGEPADVAFPPLPPPPPIETKPLLEVIGLSSDTGLSDISIDVRPGEIVGLIGLVGSGRSELARAIFGADPSRGTVRIAGADYANRTPRNSVAHGLAFVPEDRRKQGLDLVQAVRPNMSLPHLGLVSRLGVLRPGEERRRTAEMIRHFNIVPGQIDGEVAYYSGGNQQKVLLSKWVYGAPKVVILDEPSRGVDIGARRRIHDFVVELARGGAAVILISSELEEVISLSHRGYLMREGRIIECVDCRTLGVEDALFRLFNVQRGAEAGPRTEVRS